MQYVSKRPLPSALLALCCACAVLAAPAAQAARRDKPQAMRHHGADGQAEARLIEIYRLIGQGRTREAMPLAEALVAAHPNFQLAQLVHGDLLAARTRPLRLLGDAPDNGSASSAVLAELREESQLRMRALRERPPAGAVPSQFLQLSARNRHAIAIDTSRARLYLFEHGEAGLKLVADYYISVGKAGIDKVAEGDLRTPLGVYHITSNLDPKSLKDFYGAGALPINYPNPYDVRRGRTGGGIWLHGTPPTQFARAPKSTDGCVVMANPDLLRIARTVEPRTTPVVIARRLDWVQPTALEGERRAFGERLAQWGAARASGDLSRTLAFYSNDFNQNGKTLADWTPQLKAELAQAAGRPPQLKDLSFLAWDDNQQTMVVTFGEVVEGRRSGTVKRQYWVRQAGVWRIFFEGVIG